MAVRGAWWRRWLVSELVVAMFVHCPHCPHFRVCQTLHELCNGSSTIHGFKNPRLLVFPVFGNFAAIFAIKIPDFLLFFGVFVTL